MISKPYYLFLIHFWEFRTSGEKIVRPREARPSSPQKALLSNAE